MAKRSNIALFGVIVLSAISIWTSTRLEKIAYETATTTTTGGYTLRSSNAKAKANAKVANSKDAIYLPSYSESFVLDHAQELGYKNDDWVSGCEMWNSNKTYPKLHQRLNEYALELQDYQQAIQNFSPAPNIRKTIQSTGNYDICNTLKLHPEGIQGLFPSGQLSRSRAGFVEPMLPPFRSHKICPSRQAKKKYKMDMDYLVHDFETMCRNLKPTSQIVLMDLGASLAFHNGEANPMLQVMTIYEKFGFQFDHIYAFEITPLEPEQVFAKLLPERYLSAYHWINTGVSVGESDKMNPLHSILKQFDEDDLVIVKLDIDTPSLELPLVNQLLQGGEDGIYHRLVDQFYFEHHIHLKELRPNWYRSGVNGTIFDSLDIFTTLRQKGIASHSWP